MSRGVPKEQEAAAAAKELSAGAHQREPKGQGSVEAEWPALTQWQQFQSKPASAEGGRGRAVF